MAAIINADDGAISGASGLKLSSDTSGALNIQTNGVTAIAISASQAVSFPATTSLNFTSANITTLTSSSATITNLIATSGSITTLTNNPTFGAGTANGMLYLNGSKVVTSGSAVVFNGTNMGIGVTPSAWDSGKVIEVNQLGTAFWGNGVNNLWITSNAYYNGGNFKYGTGGGNLAGAYQMVVGQHRWYLGPAGTNAGDTISFTQAMTLDASGNLLVGTTSVQTFVSGTETTLTIKGNSANKAAALSVVNASGDCIGGFGVGESIDAVYTGTATNHPVIFLANNAERARITSGGNLLVGSTSTPTPLNAISGIAAAKLLAATDGSTPTQASSIVIFGGSSGSPNAGRVFFGDNTGWEWEWGYVNSTNTYGRRFYFTDGGAAYSSTGTWGTISDESLKQDISYSSSQWNDIKSIKFRKYRFKKEVAENENAPFMLGVVAQEIEQTSPNLVYTSKIGEKSVKTSVLLMKAAVALQEAMLRIEQLESKVSQLEVK